MMTARPFYAVLEREVLKLFRQRSRLLSAMVRPLIWLLVIGAGFDAVLRGGTGGGYQQFMIPGVLGMSMLFGAMLAALSTVYDKESGVMRMLVIAPFPHQWIVVAKLLGAALAAIIQALLLLAILGALGFLGSEMSWSLLALGILATSFACAAIGMVTAAATRSLDNYAVIMNLVIFPVFFLSGALYPVKQLPPLLAWIATLNPFTYGVDILKHAALPAGSRFGADFPVPLDAGVVSAFTLVAVIVACVRFSRESAVQPLIHVVPKGRKTS
jgi:ABC-2 type transport system permease protein